MLITGCFLSFVTRRPNRMVSLCMFVKAMTRNLFVEYHPAPPLRAECMTIVLGSHIGRTWHQHSAVPQHLEWLCSFILKCFSRIVNLDFRMLNFRLAKWPERVSPSAVGEPSCRAPFIHPIELHCSGNSKVSKICDSIILLTSSS